MKNSTKTIIYEQNQHTLKTLPKTEVKNSYRPKLSKLVAGLFTMGLTLQTINPVNIDARKSINPKELDWDAPVIELPTEPVDQEPTETDDSVEKFIKEPEPTISEQDRNDLALFNQMHNYRITQHNTNECEHSL